MTAAMPAVRTNVLIVGKTGVGKSSLLNYLFGDTVAEVGDGRPTTEEGIHRHKPFLYNGISFVIYDSWGMEPGKAGQWKALVEEEVRKNNAKEVRDWFHTVIYCISAEHARIEDFEIKEILSPLMAGGNRILFALTKAGVSEANTMATAEVLKKEFPDCTRVEVESVSVQPLSPSKPPTVQKGREELMEKICHNLWDNLLNKSIDKFKRDTRDALNKKLTSETLNYFEEKAGLLGIFTVYGEEFKQDIIGYAESKSHSILKKTMGELEANINAAINIASEVSNALRMRNISLSYLKSRKLYEDSFSAWDNGIQEYVVRIFENIIFPISLLRRKNIMADKVKEACIKIVDGVNERIETHAEKVRTSLGGYRNKTDGDNINKLIKDKDMYGLFHALKNNERNRRMTRGNASNQKLIDLLNRIERKNPSNDILVELYKRHKEKTVEDLVLDLRRDASSTIGWVLTGPVDYDECVKRVAIKSGVSEDDLTDDEEKNELLILHTCLKKYFEKLDPAEREAKKQEIFKEFGEESKDVFKVLFLGSGTAFLSTMQVVGPPVIRQVIFRSITIFAGGQVAINALRFAALAIPFLNIAMAAWLMVDIAGPAYRKIIPSVLNIALLRLEDKV